MIDYVSSISAFVSGIFAAMGFGGGSILIICLTVFQNFPQHLAQGINLLFFIPIATTALIFHSIKKLIVWRYAIIFMFLGLLGAAIGSYLSMFINPFFLRKIFGVFLLFIGITQIFKKS